MHSNVHEWQARSCWWTPHLIDVVFSLLGFLDPVLDHASGELGIVEGVDQHLIIQNVALGLLEQPQDLVLQLLFRQPQTPLNLIDQKCCAAITHGL